MSERAELPGMSLMEHLDELRKRIVHSAIYLACGFGVAWIFHNRIVELFQEPLIHIGKSLVFTHPMDALNLYLQASLVAGAIIASPFIFYQVWLFIAPGLYQRERRFVANDAPARGRSDTRFELRVAVAIGDFEANCNELARLGADSGGGLRLDIQAVRLRM